MCLDDEGHLVCSYLGTDPSLFVVPPPDSREIDYDNQDKEMRDLQRAIKESSHKAGDDRSLHPDYKCALIQSDIMISTVHISFRVYDGTLY